MRNDDPYLYDDADVLINKLGIKNDDELDLAEARFVSFRIVALRKQGFKIESVFDIQKIHKFIFEPLFDWAGEFRRIDMYKRERILSGMSVYYSPCAYIEEDLKSLDKKFKLIDWKECSEIEKISYIADTIQELWQIHSFREGNTRTTALFLYFLIKQCGLHINAEFLGENASYFRNALVLASIGFRSRKEFLLGMVSDCVSYLDKDTNKYKTIDGFDCEKYDARPHTVEKLKTIKDLRDL